ncbi:hypothetical protein FNF31_07756 [Cafeteria roenbergensis]|uniref:Bromo domain-containing protein n=1 Tax=Cafeteria roenbergensis TaxID=33653 RepID=A0A5A8C367_CAFRO|nr:hypothetical protein FNF31_07756 [Cafeteria roenbergensis]
MSGDAAAAMLRLRLLQYLARIRRDDCYGLLNDEVNPEEVPGYADVIKQPMAWETMHKKILANEYDSIGAFEADFRLTCDNAMTFNAADTPWHEVATALLKAHGGLRKDSG